jgi:hypothetical protein
MNNMDEDIYVKREKNIRVEGSALTGFDTKQINAITARFPSNPELHLADRRLATDGLCCS